jgi:hypothetical protein
LIWINLITMVLSFLFCVVFQKIISKLTDTLVSMNYQLDLIKKILLEETKENVKTHKTQPMSSPLSPFKKTMSEEHRNKIREAALKRHAERRATEESQIQ